MDDGLRALQIDAIPRFQPLRLDKMFLRAEDWESSVPGTSFRPPSPPQRTDIVLALPNALSKECNGISPLSGLFEYPELLPHVLQHFNSPKELAVLARVNRGFCEIARRKLYSSIWIRPWEEGCHLKIALLFDTLRQNPELCGLVKHLDVRFFPLGASSGDRYELSGFVLSSISMMRSLERLVWTRDKSLNPQVVEAISSLPHLRYLEITGHSYRYFDPLLLGKMPALEDLRIMMPDSVFIAALPGIIQALDDRSVGGLKGLGIICLSSPLVDDALLENMAPRLKALRRFTLWGCSRVSRGGVYHVLTEAEHLEELSLDALPHSGLLDLSQAPDMPRLSSFSLSFPAPSRDPLDPNLEMPTPPPTPRLDALHLTLSATRRFCPLGSIERLQTQIDFGCLLRFSLLNLVVGVQTLTTILSSANRLEELYISTNDRATVLDCDALRGSQLRVLHVNTPEKWGPTIDDLTTLAGGMPCLQQIGSANRVYEVIRRIQGGEHVVELLRWSKTTTPAYFMVWRG